MLLPPAEACCRWLWEADCPAAGDEVDWLLLLLLVFVFVAEVEAFGDSVDDDEFGW